jgi:hypothetical protein
MNKLILLLLGLVVGGCYTTMTSVFSSYDLKPRGRVERQPDYLSEERPYLALRDNLLISFNNVPGRSIKPNLETCEQSLDDEISIVLYSDKKYALDLSRVIIRSDNKIYRVSSYRPFYSDIASTVQSGLTIQVAVMSKGFTEFKNTVNHNLNDAYDLYVGRLIDSAGINLQFDGKFSCGENAYEMDLFFTQIDSGKQEKYTIYFFPWKRSITPH